MVSYWVRICFCKRAHVVSLSGIIAHEVVPLVITLPVGENCRQLSSVRSIGILEMFYTISHYQRGEAFPPSLFPIDSIVTFWPSYAMAECSLSAGPWPSAILS